ncbi:LamG domain-containing protein [Candidatus Poribacteria bacterium]|nr:LamG domain-containing protein [Candidatus Poribacteria bacterium]
MTEKLLGPICICLVVLGLMFSSQSFAKIDPGTAVGVWLFEGDVKDSSGKRNDGKLMKGATLSNDAKFNKGALSLDGVDDYVLVPTSASLDSTAQNYTGTAWIKFRRKGGAAPGGCCADDQMVIAFSTNWHNILNVFGRGGRAIPGAVEVGSGELSPSWLSGPTPVDDNQWHHLAFTYDGAKKTIYVDGKVDIAQNTTGTFGVKGIDAFIGGTPTERLALGLLDEVGMFNVPLTVDDIKTIMDNGLAGTLGLVAVSPKGRLTTTWATIKSQR